MEQTLIDAIKQSYSSIKLLCERITSANYSHHIANIKWICDGMAKYLDEQVEKLN